MSNENERLASNRAVREIEKALSAVIESHPDLLISWGYRHVLFDNVSVDIDIRIRPTKAVTS